VVSREPASNDGAQLLRDLPLQTCRNFSELAESKEAEHGQDEHDDKDDPKNGQHRSPPFTKFEVVEENGAPTLRPRWVSRDMVSPLPPAIVNGVVFALSSGEFRSSDPQLTAAQRAQRSSPAILYALDASTGKELWNSGSTITSFVHSGGLAAGGGRVYVGGYDGTQYAFGFPMEH